MSLNSLSSSSIKWQRQTISQKIDTMRIITSLLFLMTMLCSEVAAQVSYSMERKNNKYVCEGTANCNYDPKNTFGRAVLWSLDNAYLNKEEKFQPEYNFANYALKVRGAFRGNNTDDLYTFTLQIAVEDGKFHYLIDDIRCTPQKGVFAAMKVVVFDKLNLDKKPQNKVYIDEFNSLCKQYVESVAQSVFCINLVINHWDNIVRGNVVKGMNPNEVRLAKGKPINISENSQRVVWSYDSGTVVMFENGAVTGVVN